MRRQQQVELPLLATFTLDEVTDALRAQFPERAAKLTGKLTWHFGVDQVVTVRRGWESE